MVMEEYTALGQTLSSVVFAMVCAGLLAVGGIIPAASPVYDLIWSHWMPLGAALYLLESDIGRLAETGASALLAFALGAVGSLLGTLAAWRCVGSWLPADGASTVCAALCASYIGGSLNFAAVIQALQLKDATLAATAMAVDNVVMALYLAVIHALPVGPRSARPARAPAALTHSADSAAREGLEHGRSATAAAAAGRGPGAVIATDAAGGTEGAARVGAATEGCSDWAGAAAAEGNGSAAAASPEQPRSRRAAGEAARTTPEHVRLTASVVCGAACCLAGDAAAQAASAPGFGLAFMAVVASAVAALRPALGLNADLFTGAQPLARLLMTLFFATIGAASGAGALPGSAPLLAFVALQLAVHLVVVLGGATALRVPLDLALVASNANVGGPATAVAMASARGWTHLTQAAMLLGALGYCVGTALGLWVHTLL